MAVGGALANPLGAHHPRRDLDNETYVANVCPTIGCVSNGGGANGPGRTVDDCESLIVGAVSSKWSKGTGGPAGDECYNLVAHTLRAEHDASEDGTGRGTPIIAFDTTQITSGENRNNPQPGDPCHPLAKSAHAPAIAFHPTQDPIHSTNGTTHALSCGSKNGGSSVAIATGFNGDTTPKFGNEVATTMRAQQGGEGYGVIHKFQVRRLTPGECEKLQGFPPGYSEGFSDSVRYKMLGNAVCVPVVEWIAKRIKATLTP
jgi:DNA (cytosine-5)-methyltransferase 1